MRRIEWSESAERDLFEITTFIGADNPLAARRVGERIIAAIDKLAFMPTARAGRVAGAYEKPVRSLPYIIAFQLPDKLTLRVLRIIHGARDWPVGGWPEE